MNDLLNFLKIHSDVDIPFIEDFVAIQKGDQTHAPFKIDLEIMAKWLRTFKRNISSFI